MNLTIANECGLDACLTGGGKAEFGIIHSDHRFKRKGELDRIIEESIEWLVE
ncbi:MAG: hypothetical protein IKK70_02130 [Clostridia bacterium]|nr:hypothetical protein [Clostridia bacterium]